VIVQLRRDPRLGFIRVLGPLATGLLVLYALYLATAGQWLGMGLALTLALLAGVQFWHMRGREEAGAAGLRVAAINVAGCLLALAMSGQAALPWLFPVLMTNHFLCTPGRATLVSLPLLLVLFLFPELAANLGERFSAVAVTVLTMSIGHALSLRMNDDRVELEELASLDSLTGLPNRRMLERTLTRQIDERRERQRLNGLVILDVDHFKEVNDLYGHAAGDATLADLAAILRFEVRDNDRVFRFGGEEFVVLLRIESIEELEAATERLRRTIRSALRGPGGRITISLGAARYNGETHWQDWFSRADAALYIAKNNGRDSYRIADHLL
jgi:diguanylate cyclase (GGDEF)-like protein